MCMLTVSNALLMTSDVLVVCLPRPMEGMG